MKDYYYILGLKQTASTEEVKKAYRRLSLKFHPDKNDGDEYFTELFKEIQEAYEVLVDSSKRIRYDDLKNSGSTNKQNNTGSNFNPDVEYFKSNKLVFEFDEEVTFSWKTINADKVILKPFGFVPPIGQKTYKIKDIKNETLTFELVAENTNISRQAKSSLTLSNKTYKDLYLQFKEQLKREEYRDKTKHGSSKSNKNNASKNILEDYIEFKTVLWVILLFVVAIIISFLTK